MKVSVITVCFNSESTIRQTIESVLSQDYADIEYIVVDGLSTDGTMQVINEYCYGIHKVISEGDDGLYDAMNKGISVSTGAYISILNSDDVYCGSSVISDVVKLFGRDSSVPIVLGNVQYFDGDIYSKSVRMYSSYFFSPWQMRFGFMPAHPAAFIHRSIYKKYGAYDVSYSSASDFDFFVRIVMCHHVKYVKMDNCLVRMRVGGVSSSGYKSYLRTTSEVLMSLRRNGVYSNILFVLLRLPIKFINQYLFR